MKSKSIAFFAAILLISGMAFAEEITKSTLVFSTPGPDVYADGTQVRDGETYLLVFVPAETDAWSVSNAGAVEGALPVAKSVARKGACKPLGVLFGINDATYANGTFKIVLLDTRGEDGLPGSGYTYSYGIAGETAGLRAGTVKVFSVASSLPGGIVAGGNLPSLPQDFPEPRITGIAVQGESAVLSAKVAEGSRYAVEVADSLTGEWKKATMSQNAAILNADGGIAIPVDSGKKQQFFKIVRGE